jgi:hypothetical protein
LSEKIKSEKQPSAVCAPAAALYGTAVNENDILC